MSVKDGGVGQGGTEGHPETEKTPGRKRKTGNRSVGRTINARGTQETHALPQNRTLTCGLG